MLINNKEYTRIEDFDIINNHQFIASTNYGIVLFDISMDFDSFNFQDSESCIEYINNNI